MSGDAHDANGRVTIVTGAASGIGRAVAERLLAAGASVVAVDRAAETLAWTDEVRHTPRLATVVGDVTSDDTNAAAVALAIERFGRVDAAVFNAGVSMSGDLIDLSMEEFDRSIAVNVRAVVLGIRSVVPAMRDGGQGRIVVTASTSGIGGDPNLWAYNTAKGAVVNLVRAAAVDLGADGITVNAVCPGPTETAMTSRLQSFPELHEELRRTIPLQRWGRPEEIAAVIAFLTSADASFITGAIVPVDGGVTANTGQFRPRSLPG
jgi:meso-butanediol dehydrogenase/(S,S)-butanediol dehydrogenase/diacetyl reductase